MQQLCEQTCQLVRTVGHFIRSEIGKVAENAIEKKYFNNLVSYVDKTAELRLIEGLRALLPDSGFIAEEGTTAAQPHLDWQWIIDPLDGTTNFLHQIPFFAISVALQHKGKTTMGIVLEVNRNELFYAYTGSGVYCNNSLVKVRPNDVLQDAFLATGFPYYDFRYTQAYLDLLRELMPKTRGIRRIGAAALDLAYTAAGRFDAFFEQSLSPWDVAAGAFLVQQAGGLVTDFSGGDDYIYGKEILGGNPAIHNQLLPLLQKAGFSHI